MAKDPDEKTSLGSSLPPLSKAPGQRPVAPEPTKEEAGGDEDARFGGTKVPQKSTLQRLIEERSNLEERTSLGQGPPPTPRKRVAEPPPGPAPATPRMPPRPAATPAPAAVPAGEDDRTVVARHAPKAKARLQRVAPAGRSGVVSLTRTSYTLGRSNTCDIPLFSNSASRQHAKLTSREGKWFVEPLEGKLVKANGSPITGPTRLLHKMSLQLGEDELIFLDEGAPASPERPAPAEPAPREEGGPSIVRILWIAAVLVCVLFFLLLLRGT